MSQDQEQSSPLNCFSIIKPLTSSRNPIYHAFDKKFNRPVVLKTFPYIYDTNKSYLREKNFLNNLNHPYIIQMFEAVDKAPSNPTVLPDKEVSYLALEYAPHGDMMDIISRCSKLPEILARTIFHQIIEVVSYLHRRKIAHMDLKVDNILIDDSFKIKLIDFDLSQAIDSAFLEAQGTPGYRAPEVKKGFCSNLQAADIYSAAVILFIMLSGHPPYMETCKGGEFEYDAFYRLLRKDVNRFWKVHAKHKGNDEFYSEDFRELVGKMLAEEARERPSIEEIKNSKWFIGPVLEGEEYVAEMKKYLAVDCTC